MVKKKRKGGRDSIHAEDMEDRKGGLNTRTVEGVKNHEEGRYEIRRKPPAIFPTAVELSSFVSFFPGFFSINYWYRLVTNLIF